MNHESMIFHFWNAYQLNKDMCAETVFIIERFLLVADAAVISGGGGGGGCGVPVGSKRVQIGTYIWSVRNIRAAAPDTGRSGIAVTHERFHDISPRFVRQFDKINWFSVRRRHDADDATAAAADRAPTATLARVVVVHVQSWRSCRKRWRLLFVLLNADDDDAAIGSGAARVGAHVADDLFVQVVIGSG